MLVRAMTPEDIDQVVSLYERYFSEACDAIPSMLREWDENSVIDTIRSYCAHWDRTWLVACENQRITGFIAGFASESPWNSQLINANIAFLYLSPEQRSLEHLKLLYREFLSWANTIGAHKITGGDIGINLERTRTLYEYLGFSPVLLMAKDNT